MRAADPAHLTGHLRPRHDATHCCDTSLCTAAATSRCDKTLALGTQVNLEEGKCELVSKFNMADQQIQRRCNKKKLLGLSMMLLSDNEYKEDAGHVSGFQGEKKEGRITLY